MAKNIMVAPVGDDIDALFVGIKEFPTQKVILITREETKGKADETAKDLDRFKIPVEIRVMKGHSWEEMFRIVGEIKQEEEGRDSNIIMNVTTADKMSSCVAVSAAFVNGLKAMGVQDNEAMLLPVLKFSYYKTLTDKKMNLLKLIYNDKDCCASLDSLSQKTGMSLPLISYHVNGNLKSDGLKDLGLVETVERGGKTAVHITTLGKLLVKGYVQPQQNS